MKFFSLILCARSIMIQIHMHGVRLSLIILWVVKHRRVRVLFIIVIFIGFYLVGVGYLVASHVSGPNLFNAHISTIRRCNELIIFTLARCICSHISKVISLCFSCCLDMRDLLHRERVFDYWRGGGGWDLFGNWIDVYVGSCLWDDYFLSSKSWATFEMA